MKPQSPAEQLAVAFAGAMHGVQLVPHDSGAVLLTQVPLHSWKPLAQLNVQLPLVQVVLAFALVRQLWHAEPHAVMSLSATQELPHRCVPLGQLQACVVVLQLAPVGQRADESQPARH